MRTHKGFLMIGLVAVSLVFSGCGTQLYELTAEEEELIVEYAAHVVAKHNIYQKDGISCINIEDLETENTEKPQDSEDTSGSEDTQTPSGGGNSDTENTGNETVSMEAALGLADSLSINYVGSSVEEYVKEGPGYVAEPGVYGNLLYVMKFQMKNISDEAVKVDNLSADIGFKLECGKVTSSHRKTFLSNDFSTYIGTVKSGEIVEVVLIFEIKPEDAEKITAPILKISVDNVTKKVKL